jgi:hypothetical protein
MDNRTIDTITEDHTTKKQEIETKVCPYEIDPEKPSESLCTDAIAMIPTRKQEYCLSNKYTECIIYQECGKRAPVIDRIVRWINEDIS